MHTSSPISAQSRLITLLGVSGEAVRESEAGAATLWSEFAMICRIAMALRAVFAVLWEIVDLIRSGAIVLPVAEPDAASRREAAGRAERAVAGPELRNPARRAPAQRCPAPRLDDAAPNDVALDDAALDDAGMMLPRPSHGRILLEFGAYEPSLRATAAAGCQKFSKIAWPAEQTHVLIVPVS